MKGSVGFIPALKHGAFSLTFRKRHTQESGVRTQGVAESAPQEVEPGDEEAAEVDLTELTLKERIALATVQRPAMGFLLVVLSLFAFTFLIALAMLDPVIGGLFILGMLAFLAVGTAVFVALRRLGMA